MKRSWGSIALIDIQLLTAAAAAAARENSRRGGSHMSRKLEQFLLTLVVCMYGWKMKLRAAPLWNQDYHSS